MATKAFIEMLDTGRSGEETNTLAFCVNDQMFYGTGQGILTEGEGSVQLTSSLR